MALLASSHVLTHTRIMHILCVRPYTRTQYRWFRALNTTSRPPIYPGFVCGVFRCSVQHFFDERLAHLSEHNTLIALSKCIYI